MNLRHITRFTYTFTNFQGWRVAIRRQGITLTRYFSDRQYDSPEAACEHAIRFRDKVLAELDSHPEEQAAEILKAHRPQPKKLYPAGLKPTHTPALAEDTEEHCTTACSVRSNKVMHGILKSVCNTLQLDTASVLKLSLYLFTLNYGQASAASPMNIRNNAPLYAHTSEQPAHIVSDEENGECLYRIIQELESRGIPAGLPSFEEFATGKCSRITPEEPPPPVQTYAEPPPVAHPGPQAPTHATPHSSGTSTRNTTRRHVSYTPESCTTNHHSRPAQLAPQAFLPPIPRAALPSAANIGKSARLFPGASPSSFPPSEAI